MSDRTAMMTALMLAMLALLIAAFFAVARAADADNGARLAQRWCASCHVVAPEQSAGNPDVPSFAAIGRKPGFDQARIANFLQAPHPVMPNMSLSRSEAADLAAYIASQGR